MRWRRWRWRSELELPDAAVQRALAGFAGVGRRFERHGEAAGARRRSLHAGRRLRPPPGGDGRRAGRGARRLPGPAPGAGLPAAPLHPHARLLRRLRRRAAALRRRAADRGLRRRRGADRRRRRPHAGAGAARGRPRRRRSSSTTSPALPQAIADTARDGDVVITMGAGSIGGVPGQLRRRRGRRDEDRCAVRWARSPC